MSLQFHYSEDTVRVISLEEGSLVDKLKPAIYYINFNQFMGFFLDKGKDSFSTPEQLFGPVKRRIEKIKRTFDDRTSGTGILLTGDKGAGKTMLAEVLCNNMIEAGIPVIIIIEE
jgi:DNA replication protein DnaC